MGLYRTPLNVGDTISEQQSTSSAVDVRCSQVDIAGDYTKKKHVLRLNTFSGSELLLQAEDAGDMVQWIHALQAQSGASEKETFDMAGHVAYMSESRNAYSVLVGRPEEIRLLERRDIDERIKLKWF
ncbi:hypothetical protein ANN_19719 [Periplaneta americana]|uniref:PH domain-containing protein n=1 Tax=Periplaneta americana TaxID=6978 RepID=A0ABQ8SAN0_PERAM|nr:hypothetical protein ANN_19719 [Periplaneta americana]